MHTYTLCRFGPRLPHLSFFFPGLRLVTALMLQGAPLTKRKEKLSLLTNLLYQNVFWLDLLVYFVCVCVLRRFTRFDSRPVCVNLIPLAISSRYAATNCRFTTALLLITHSSRYFGQICSNELQQADYDVFNFSEVVFHATFAPEPSSSFTLADSLCVWLALFAPFPLASLPSSPVLLIPH
jgi:hypothetical protein